MFDIGIRKQKKELRSRLKPEYLTANPQNKELIKTFVATDKGKKLEKYLKEYAWEEDLKGATRVYLVKDKKSGTIVFFFALNTGLLYKDLNNRDVDLTDIESEIVETCVQLGLSEDSGLTIEDIINSYDNESIDKDKLRQIINDEIERKKNAKIDKERTKEENTKRVYKTYPAIVLTHFCRNTNAVMPETKFPLGFFVFWEILMPKIKEITALVGCQYLYLFAADNTDEKLKGISLYDMIYDFDEEAEENTPTYNLVDYYMNELKFERVHGMTILKPNYDTECFSLIQEIEKLEKNRTSAWVQHSDEDEEMDTKRKEGLLQGFNILTKMKKRISKRG